MRYGPVFILAALALGAMAAPAWAERSDRPVGEQSDGGLGHQKGSSTIPDKPETEVDLIADVLYDSNVARSDEARAKARGLTLPDELFEPGGSFKLARAFGNQIVFLQGSGRYNFHRVNTILNKDSVDLYGGVNAHIGPCQETPTGKFSRHESELAETGFVGIANTTTEEEVSLGVSCGRPIGFSPRFNVSESWRSNDRAPVTTLDTRTFNASPSLAYQNPVIGNVSLFGAFGQTDFLNRFSPITHQQDGFDVFSGGVRYERKLGGRLDADLSLSYTALEPYLPGARAFHGISYSVEATYQLGRRIEAHIEASRATKPSNRVGALYSIDDDLQGDVTYHVGSRLKFKLQGSRDAKENVAAPFAGGLDLRNSTVTTVLADAVFDLNSHFTFTLYGGHEQRDANDPGLGYSSVRVGLTTKFTF